MNETRDSIKDIWGDRTPYVGEWPLRVDERTEDTPDKWVQSSCVLCSVGCGIDIGVKNGKIVGVRGRAEDITNHGRLGPKGLHGWVANRSQDRLTRPLIRKEGELVEASWDEAMDLIVQKSKKVIEQHTGLGIGFYTSGQLFLEEYYVQAIIGKAGIGTPHMDGNTRLCTATAAAALKLSFGTDGQPGSFTDIDTAETIMLCGHNIASQQTVMWMRILDRLEGPNPPKIIVIDPRTTFTAAKATVHLAPRVGTNLAVMNGLLNLVIQSGGVDQEYVNAHTTGFEELKKVVAGYTPARVEELSGIPVEKLLEAGRILSTTKSLLSTVLQGFYQSMQATAASVQVNNLHLIRGFIGRDGCGILQMNGQPTSQNTRETGADGDLPGFRNWGNEEHIQELADLWNVDPIIIPHWAPPTHAMEIWRYCEQGSIRFLWISGTNPAVSLPELERVRTILQKEDLFVIVNDAYLTETAAYADVVLPAAIWGEKTGTFTNIDRTVHLSHKAIEPPGEARADLDIFFDYARRMDFRDKSDAPLIKWSTPEEVFEGWKDCTRGRPCDYTGLSYARLTGGSGIQWPCNEQHPDGTRHIYTDGVFNTGQHDCEAYGHDLDTGAAVTQNEYKAIDPKGKAFIRAAEFRPPHELPDAEYPMMLTTGRLVYHFHTRTKTGRARALNDAAPDAFVQISEEDAAKYGIAEGDMVEVSSRRGMVTEPARVGGIIPGHVFIPFHYGYWDNPGRMRAANELTITAWDPVSKQPHFKYAAVRIKKLHGGILGSVGDALEAVKDAVTFKKA
jgi:ferredoxin-nitrate reductase